MQVEFVGSEQIEQAIRHTGKRLVFAAAAGAALAAGAVAWLARGGGRDA